MDTRRNPISRVFLLSMIIPAMVFLTIGCMLWQPLAPDDFPDTDLVFQPTTLFGGMSSVGFVNADGTNLSYLEIDIQPAIRFNLWFMGSPILPILTGDGQALVFRIHTGSHHHGGYLVVMLAGNRAVVCPLQSGSSRPAFTSDQSSVVTDLASPGGRLSLFRLEDCIHTSEMTDGTLFEIDIERNPTRGALSPDGRFLLFKALPEQDIAELDPGYPTLFVRNLESGDEIPIGRGSAPAWSPDGDWIAYRGEGGIFRVRPDGSENELLVEYTSPTRSSDDWLPLPSWSPDGRWLVYHKCTLEPGRGVSCSQLEDNSIFKFNLVPSMIIPPVVRVEWVA